MSFEHIVRGGGVLTQNQGVTGYALACRCEWSCPGYPAKAYHAGIDVAKPGAGVVVLTAAGHGRCVKVGRVLVGYSCSGLGPFAPCIRSGGVDLWYGHAAQSLVAVGQVVRPGDPVAIMGSVGCSTGRHVHFEAVAAGADPNSCQFLNAWHYVSTWPGPPLPVPVPPPAPPPAPEPARTFSILVPALLVAGGIALAARARTA